MELTDERRMWRNLRRYYSTVGWCLLIYYGLLNVCVVLEQMGEIAFSVMGLALRNQNVDIWDLIYGAADSAWGYFLAAAVGLLIVTLWKKPAFWTEQIWQKGKPMRFGSFVSLLCLFLSMQSVFQYLMALLESFFNLFDVSLLEGYEEIFDTMDSFSMFLYSGVLAPVVEELLFRGLIFRHLRPYGKRFAILGSAFAFGIFHGNLIQIPYAFLCGLVLGYTASEYSIAWAMLLHMINNLVIGDLLTRLTWNLPEFAASFVISGVLIAFTVGAVITLIVNRRKIRSYFREETLNPVCVQCFFTAPGMIVLMVIMAVSTVISMFTMLR